MKILKKQHCYAVVINDSDVYEELCGQEEIDQVPILCGTRELAEYFAKEANIEWNQDNDGTCYCGDCGTNSPMCYDRVVFSVREVQIYWN
jgi:hypothetical protein